MSNEAALLSVPTTDVKEMTDRELLEESVENQRKILAVVGGVMSAMQQHPMFAMLLGGR